MAVADDDPIDTLLKQGAASVEGSDHKLLKIRALRELFAAQQQDWLKKWHRKTANRNRLSS